MYPRKQKKALNWSLKRQPVRETKRFNISESTKETKTLFFLISLLWRSTYKVFPFRQTKPVLWCVCSSLTTSDRRCTKRHLSFLGAQSFICYRVLLGDGVPARTQQNSCSLKSFCSWAQSNHEAFTHHDISHRGVFSPDKQTGAAYSQSLPETPGSQNSPPNKCILAHGLTFNKGFFFTATPVWEDFTEPQKLGKLSLQDIERVGLISFPFKTQEQQIALTSRNTPPRFPRTLSSAGAAFTWWKAAGRTELFITETRRRCETCLTAPQ